MSDERWVDVHTDASNENLVTKHLLAHLSQDTNFVGLKTGHVTSFDAVDEIHQRLDSIPQLFTLTVLSLGEDGHIASLFPNMSTVARALQDSVLLLIDPLHLHRA